jgi:RNA polymerase primary sigma factor
MTNEEIVTRIQAGEDVRDNLALLYQQNRGLIGATVRKYSGYAEADDLYQTGYIGLHRAAFLWDHTKGASFAGYATLWIQAIIGRYLEQCGTAVRIPGQRRRQILHYKRIVNDYQTQFNRDPTAEELAEALEISPDKVEVLRITAQMMATRSTDEPITEDDDSLTLGDTIPDAADHMAEIERRIDHDNLSHDLWELVDGCGERESKIIRERYLNGKTQKECGDELGISFSRVSEIEQEVLQRLRSGRNRKKVRELYEVAFGKSMKRTSRDAFLKSGNSQQEAFILTLERFKLLFPDNSKRIDGIIDQVIDAIADE